MIEQLIGAPPLSPPDGVAKGGGNAKPKPIQLTAEQAEVLLRIITLMAMYGAMNALMAQDDPRILGMQNAIQQAEQEFRALFISPEEQKRMAELARLARFRAGNPPVSQ